MNENKEQFLKAYELEKTAYVNYVSSFSASAIATLVRGGMDFEKAAGLVKEAAENDNVSVSYKTNILAFEKAAEYISDLEAKLEGLEKKAEKADEVIAADPNNPLTKLASVGFTAEEIEYMSQLPENLIEKVASSNNQPYNMGSAVGVAREKTDALLEFILG
jgi:uncharacterized protein involved in high-affinity Fe2+ transport